jgi:L-ascorbate metabolism protein UlaG (beta-lactamase superfamily)
MKIGKIGHASFTIITDDVNCLLDPVFTPKFESGTNEFYPPVECDVPTLTRRCNLLVLSHMHFDHFSVQTIAALDRSIPVIYPREETAIGRCLERMGFMNTHGTIVGEIVTCGTLDIAPTRSVGKPKECGYLFTSGGHSVWAMVDTVVDDDVVSEVLAGAKQIDLLLAKYQPIIEEALYQDGL